MKNIGKILMGLLLIITSCIYVMKAKAETTIGDTSELKSINITKRVTDVISNVNATFYYNVTEERNENPESC